MTDSLALKAIDLLLDMICIVDVDGRYVFVSPACEQILGYTADELLGRNMIEFVHPEDRERTLNAASEIMSGTPAFHLENRYVRKDGRIVDIMWTARWWETDKVRVAVARDITALKRAERQQRAIYRIAEAGYKANSLSVLYQHVHRIIGDLFPADGFSIALHDRLTNTMNFPYISGSATLALESQVLGAGAPIEEVIRSGEAVLAGFRHSATTTDGDAAANENIGSWLGAALISQTGVMGAMVLQLNPGSGTYTEDDKQLLQSISNQVTTAIERKQLEAELHHMARYDSLTDLPNRIVFMDRLDVAIRRSERETEYLALLYIDFDEFKSINDTYGHEIGDLLLQEVARRLVGAVRKSDTVCRIGGDEFTILLNNIHGPECADIVVNKIHAVIDQPFDLNGVTLKTSASIGVAMYPEDGRDRDQLIRHADAGMYKAKRSRSAAG